MSNSDEELMLKRYEKKLKKGGFIGECFAKFVEVKAEKCEENIVTAVVKMKEASGMIAMLRVADTIKKEGGDSFEKVAEKQS